VRAASSELGAVRRIVSGSRAVVLLCQPIHSAIRSPKTSTCRKSGQGRTCRRLQPVSTNFFPLGRHCAGCFMSTPSICIRITASTLALFAFASAVAPPGYSASTLSCLGASPIGFCVVLQSRREGGKRIPPALHWEKPRRSFPRSRMLAASHGREIIRLSVVFF